MPGGRPTRYKKEFSQLAFNYCLLGATDKELAEFFEVSEVTINAWKKAHSEFLKSLNEGKAIADGKVARSLYSNAVGYVKAVEKPMAESLGGGMGSKIKIIKYDEYFPPNTTAQIFWLKNRQPAKFRDKQEIETSGTTTTIVKGWGEVMGGDGPETK